MDASERVAAGLRLVAGGQPTTIAFGPTFVVIEGFSIRDGATIQWWLRLDKGFSISDGATPAQWHPIDVVQGILPGAQALIACVGQKVADFRVDRRGLELRFANHIALRMEWGEGELSCAQLDGARTGRHGSELIVMLCFPDDLP